MAGVRGVYQGQRLRKRPKPDPSMPTSKMVLWEGLGSDKSSVLGLLPLCSQLLLASRTLEQFCPLLLLPGMPITRSLPLCPRLQPVTGRSLPWGRIQRNVAQ